MIFIGYANDDRYSIVESIVFHLKNWGFHTWYDFHDMYLGDNRVKVNFEYGIEKSSYVIFVISYNTFKSQCALEELLYTRELQENSKIVLFPILYEITADDLPREYLWLKKIIYNETTKISGTFYVVNQIIEKVLSDYKNTLVIKNLSLATQNLNIIDPYLGTLINTLDSIDLDNYNARMGILYAVYLYVYDAIRQIPELPLFCTKAVERIFSLTRLNISIDHLTYGIYQDIIIIDLDYFIKTKTID